MHRTLLALSLSALGATACLADTMPSASGRSPNRTVEIMRAFEDIETTGSVTRRAEIVETPAVFDRQVRTAPCETRTFIVPSGREVRVHAC